MSIKLTRRGILIMMKQRGFSITTIIIAGIIAIIATILAISYISAFNKANRFERMLVAKMQDNENVLSNYSQKIGEAAQVPTMQAEDVRKVFEGSNTSRYGADGSKATMQWIREQNPTLNTSVYPKLMQMIEAGRDEFKTSQTQMLDIKRSYETSLGSFWTGTWMSLAGFPKEDLSKFKIVSNGYATKAFKEGKEEGPIKLR